MRKDSHKKDRSLSVVDGKCLEVFLREKLIKEHIDFNAEENNEYSEPVYMSNFMRRVRVIKDIKNRLRRFSGSTKSLF